MISALVATISGREHWLKSVIEHLEALPDDIEIVIEKDHPNWGTAMNAAAERATGDYLWLGSDDMDVKSFGDAIDYCDRGFLPAPRVLNTDGSLQSCGEWETEQEEGTEYKFPRIPFATREQFDRIGLLSIHYADVRFGTHGLRLGMKTVVCRSYEVVHHMAPEGRLDYQEQEMIRRKTERDLRRKQRSAA